MVFNGFAPLRYYMMHYRAFAKSSFRYGTCSKTKIPPNPPFPKGGNYKELL